MGSIAAPANGGVIPAPLFEYTVGPNAANSGGAFTFGTKFTVGGSDIALTQLGAYAHGGKVFEDTNFVGVWTNAGALVVSTEIGIGTGDLTGAFRYKAIASTILDAGETYRIATYNAGTDDVDAINGSFSFASVLSSVGIAHQSSYFEGATGLTFPSNANLSVRLNANAMFVAVPEPATALFCGLGSLGFGFVSYRRRKKQAA